MIEVKDKKDCCGCWACENACPKSCISMVEDHEGFRYPHVDKNVCIDCGLCEKVCPIINVEADSPKPQRAYLLQHKDENILAESTSGGAFTSIATYVIEQGGVVFGAAYNEVFEVVHTYTDNVDGLKMFRNSKYVQSYMGAAYRDVQRFLKQGRMVCFSGTPCQLEGLLRFLRRPYDNLLTVDLVCHAITSPKVFSMYVDQKKKETKGEIENIMFRDKKPYGYKYSTMSVYSGGKQVYREGVETDVMLRSFFTHINVRPSCYDCKFKKRYRMTDLTIWDCFDVYKFSKELDNDKGVTRILAHNDKGNLLMNALKDKAIIVEIDANEAIEGVKELVHSVKMNSRRQTFFNECVKSCIGGGNSLYSFFPITARARVEKSIRIALCRLGIYSQIKKLAKTVIKDLKRS